MENIKVCEECRKEHNGSYGFGKVEKATGLTKKQIENAYKYSEILKQKCFRR